MGVGEELLARRLNRLPGGSADLIADADPRWRYAVPAEPPDDLELYRIVWAGPALASDRLILVSSNGQALSVSPYSGAVLGKIELEESSALPPVFANASMYLLDDDGELSAYR